MVPSMTENIMAYTLAGVIVKCIDNTDIINRLVDPEDSLKSPKDLVDIINTVDNKIAKLKDKDEAVEPPFDSNIFIFSLNMFKS